MQAVAMHLNTNVRTCVAGTTEPAITIVISSFDVYSPENNPGYAKKILDFVHEQLTLPYDR